MWWVKKSKKTSKKMGKKMSKLKKEKRKNQKKRGHTPRLSQQRVCCAQD